MLYVLLFVLDWYVECTGLMCCMYWTGVLYVIHTRLHIFPVACFRIRGGGGGGGEISPKIVRMYTDV